MSNELRARLDWRDDSAGASVPRVSIEVERLLDTRSGQHRNGLPLPGCCAGLLSSVVMVTMLHMHSGRVCSNGRSRLPTTNTQAVVPTTPEGLILDSL